jgi:hypothetical protein
VVTVLPITRPPRKAQAAHHVGVEVRRATGMQHGAVLGGQVGGVDDVLYAHWNAEQVAEAFATRTCSVGALGLGHHMVTIKVRPGLHLVLDLFDTLQQCRHVFGDRELTGVQPLVRFDGAQCGQLRGIRLHRLYSTSGSHVTSCGKM